jgi:hypothetical protein
MRCSDQEQEDTMPENKNDQKQGENKPGQQDRNRVGQQPMQGDDKNKKGGMGQGQGNKEGKNIPDEGLDQDDRITQRNPAVPRGNEEE